MSAALSERELQEWMIYYSLEPWGPERADLNSGIIASTIANVNRDSKVRSEPFKAEDFMPKYGADPSAETEPESDDDGMAPERIMGVMERLVAHQAKVERQKVRNP